MSPLPENLERVADAGGWDARAIEQAKEFMEFSSKIKEKEWKAMTITIKALKDLGSVEVIEGFSTSILDAIKLKSEELFTPLKNEVITMINDALKPVLDLLNPVVNNLTEMIGDNAAAGTIGGIAGAVLGGFVGHPAIGAMIGAIITSALNEWGKNLAQILGGDRTGEAEWWQHPLNPNQPSPQEWANEVNQWWYDLWVSLGWV